MCFPVSQWTKKHRKQLKKISPPFDLFFAICSPAVGREQQRSQLCPIRAREDQLVPFYTDQAARSINAAKGGKDPPGEL